MPFGPPGLRLQAVPSPPESRPGAGQVLVRSCLPNQFLHPPLLLLQSRSSGGSCRHWDQGNVTQSHPHPPTGIWMFPTAQIAMTSLLHVPYRFPFLTRMLKPGLSALSAKQGQYLLPSTRLCAIKFQGAHPGHFVAACCPLPQFWCDKGGSTWIPADSEWVWELSRLDGRKTCR